MKIEIQRDEFNQYKTPQLFTDTDGSIYFSADEHTVIRFHGGEVIVQKLEDATPNTFNIEMVKPFHGKLVLSNS